MKAAICAVAARFAAGCPMMVLGVPPNSFSMPLAIATALSSLTVSSWHPQSSAALLALDAKALASNGFSWVPMRRILASSDCKSKFASPTLTAIASVDELLLDVVRAVASDTPSIDPLAPMSVFRSGLLRP